MHEPTKAGWRDYASVMRPDHWLKNLFIFFGSGVAWVLLELPFDAKNILLTLYCLVPACLVASANYILNEILDAPFDRLHPTKHARSVAAGTAKESVLWILMVLLLVAAFVISWPVFNTSYLIALALLFLSGLVYNVPPVRLKDRAFLDVIAESFNNPIRLWLGWYAIAPANSFPPLSIVLAWWMFGALLMTGKRYAEYKFIDDPERSGSYRRSFKTYTEKSLLIAMITYANLFCFCAGTAVAVYRPNLVFAFPLVVAAVIAYFNAAISVQGAKLEPEELMKNPLLIVCTVLAFAFAAFLIFTPLDLPSYVGFFHLIRGH
jgi:decaprenyl-phosphate phosphoribosyltransferase